MTIENLLEKPNYVDPITTKIIKNPAAYQGRPVVACVWVNGPAQYRLQHVLTLQSMVQRNLTLEHDFVCFTDHEAAFPDLMNAGIKPIIVKPDMPGWWQKVKLFDWSHWTTHDRVLYLDLDVVIVNNLDNMFGAAHHTVAIANFGVNFRHSKYNSSVVCFNGRGPTGKVYDNFVKLGAKTVMDAMHGDQCWLWRAMGDTIHTWPRSWVQSYKYETRRNGLAPDTKITVYHGDPKPWQCDDRITKENYR